MLSIIIPSYKGADIMAKELPAFITYLKQELKDFELIIVDDGSNDNDATRKVAESNGCLFCANEVNMGKGAAVRNGMLKAKGEYRIFTDADIPFHYEAIPRFYDVLVKKGYDMVIGDRTLKESVYFEEVSKIRRAASKVFTFMVGRFITTGNFDTQCGLKGFKGEIADDLFSVSKIPGFTFDVEIIYIALKRNYEIRKQAVKLRNNETSSVNVFKHSIQMFMDILKIKMNHINGLYKKHE